MSDSSLPVSPAPHVSAKQRPIPIWVWFAVTNVVVVVAAASGIMAYLSRIPVVVTPPVEAPPPSPPKQFTTAEVVAEVQDGVVLITTYGANGDKLGLGTGFIIDPQGLVATNFHVLRGASTAEVESYGREKVQVKGVRAWNLDTDLAILELTSPPKKIAVLKLAATTQRPNAADVIAIGHPKAFTFTTTTGILSAVRKGSELPSEYRGLLQANADQVWLQTNAVISGGSSGGPLLDHTASVIGINTAVVDKYSFAIDARHLATLHQGIKPAAQSLSELTGPYERFDRLIYEFQLKSVWFGDEFEKAKSDAQRQELVATKHPALEFAPQLFELAVECEAAPVAFDALKWACKIAGGESVPAKCDETLRLAGDRLAEKFGGDSRLPSLLWGLRYSPRPGAWYVMQRIGEGDSKRDTRGIGLFCSGHARTMYGTEGDAADTVSLLEKVIQQYTDVVYHCSEPQHPEHLIAKEAEELLYQLRFLSVGRAAMEISGVGSDGAKFQLTDYRGKVVLLDFWAEWCPPCQEMWPHERQLVEELKAAPFALVGVYRGPQPTLQRLLDNKTITWKNWVDGADGPIAEQWRVNAVPTIYVLDHTGVIRYKATGRASDAEISKWVQELLAKVPKSGTPAAP